MRLAMFLVMLRSLVRDPAALAMGFVLPGLVFVIFALIFAGASGGELTVRLAVVDERADAASGRLIATMLEDKRLLRVGGENLSADDLRRQVRSGAVDIGLVVRRAGRALEDLEGEGAAPIELIGDPGRQIAVSVVEGILQQAYFKAVPEAPIRAAADVIDKRIVRLTPEQKVRIDRGLEAARGRAGDGLAGLSIARIHERQDAAAATAAPTAVVYYAGAVAVMFLLFSTLAGAMTYLDEREVGLIDRLALGPGGVGVLIDGKFLFLAVQGAVQVVVIYVVAWLGFGVELIERALPWAATTIAAAIAAAGLALGFVTACRSKQQAQTLGQMLILVVSAIGGSMVPRYLMPPSIQAAGWATPNTWAIEAYSAIFYRGEGWPTLWPSWLVLIGIGLAGLAAGHAIARRSV